MKNLGGVPSFYQNLISSFMPIGTTVIELRELKKKKKKNNMDKMGKYNWCFLTEIFCMLFSCHTFSAIKSLNVIIA